MKKKITIPESINDITLGQYQKYVSIINKEVDEFTKVAQKIEVFTGLIRSEIESIKQKDIQFINDQIDTALNLTGEFKQRFILNDIEFGMIPNFDKITAKEYFDLSSYGMEVETLNRVMAIIFRPIIDKGQGKTYLIEDYNGTEKYAEFMKQMPLTYVNGSLSFFLTLQNDLLSYFQKFTNQEQVREWELVNTFRNGVGMQHLMN